MFSLTVKRSWISELTQALLDNSSLNFDPKDDDSLTAVIYRRDPMDRYLFVTSLAGLREEEPMFGPLVFDDERQPERSPTGKPNALGFRAREGIGHNPDAHHRFDGEGDGWEIHLSARGAGRRNIGKFKDVLLPSLQVLLGQPSTLSEPLFRELWYRERLGRDGLLNAVREVPMPTSLSKVAAALTRSLDHTMQQVSGSNANDLGIYLYTGEDWRLAGREPNRLPKSIDECLRDTQERLHAFAWVSESTRPVLVRPNISPPWRKRLKLCASEAFDTSSPGFQALCIVPLLEHTRHSRPMGVIVFVSRGREPIGPGHVFLLSRLAVTASGYLSPHLAFPGFPWWPEVLVGRNAERAYGGPGFRSLPARDRRWVQRIVGELMPENSEVEITPLRSGASGARVFHCLVKDGRTGQHQVPRIVKIAKDPAIVAREARAYSLHVQNQKAGYASRIEIAKAADLPDDRWGAIVYLLVGGGEKAEPWEQWAAKSDRKILTKALEILFGQLEPWYIHANAVQKSAVRLLITEPFFEGANVYQPWLKDARKPTWTEVRTLLNDVRQADKLAHSRTSTVHGDLHAGNVFSILSGRGQALLQVALIDWGGVHSARHPLSDIGKLMSDLLYRVRWAQYSLEEMHWAHDKVRNWQTRLGLDGEDWRLALIHHTAKMLFYDDGDPSSSFFPQQARVQAWRDLRSISEPLL